MKVVIVEDEEMAANYLEQLLEKQQLLPIDEIEKRPTVKEAVEYFRNNSPDLVFMDIQLADGNSLEIFEEIQLSAPIIFTTAHSSYAIEVFQHFTLDYLLKPFDEEALHRALVKFCNIRNKMNPPGEEFREGSHGKKQHLQKRFLVSHGHQLKSIQAEDIAYFYGEGKNLFLFTFQGEDYIYDDTIRAIIESLNRKIFFKINRNYVVNIESVNKIIKHRSQKVEVILLPKPATDKPVILSKGLIKDFKIWLNK